MEKSNVRSGGEIATKEKEKREKKRNPAVLFSEWTGKGGARVYGGPIAVRF